MNAPTFFDGEFPGVRVRYHGPTDYKGSRYAATARYGDDRATVTTGYDHAANSQRANVVGAAWAARVKLLTRIGVHDADIVDASRYVGVVTDLSASDYVVTFVPRWAVEVDR